MNTLFDRLVTVFNIGNPYGTIEEKAKELTKQWIKNHNYGLYHENNLISIVENAKEADKMLTEMQGYIEANKLTF